MGKQVESRLSLSVPTPCASVIVFALIILDTTAMVLASLLSAEQEGSESRWDFDYQSLDMVVMLAARALAITVASVVIPLYIRRARQVVAHEAAMVLPTAVGDNKDTSREDVESSPLLNGLRSTNTLASYILSPTSDCDECSPLYVSPLMMKENSEIDLLRQRSMLRKKHERVKLIVFFILFLLGTVCNVVVSLKCLNFHFVCSPWQEICFASTLLWVNLEVFCFRVLLDSATAEVDSAIPTLHPHPLRFNHDVVMSKCQLCNCRIFHEGFECTSCDFDVCIECFKKKSRAHGENVLTRSDKGFTTASGKEDGVSAMGYVFRAMKLVIPFIHIVIVALVCLFVGVGAKVLLPNFQGKVLDSIIASSTQRFWHFLTWYICLSGASLLLGAVRSFCVMIAIRNISITLRTKMFSCLLYRDIAFFDGSTVGTLTSRMTNDVQGMVSPLNILVNTVLSNMILLVGGLGMCLLVNWRLAMIAFCVVGPIVFITNAYAKWSRKLNKRIFDSLAEANSNATQAFSNIRTVRSFSTEEHEKKKFEVSMKEALRRTMNDAIASAGASIATNLLDLGAMSLILGFGGWIVLTRPEQMTLGQLVTFQLYANMMNNAYQGINNVLNQFTRSAGAAERVFTMLDAKGDIDPTSGQVLDSVEGKIEVKNVVFSYQMRSSVRPILENVSVLFPANSVTAVVGKSGCGKSTLIHLILRFYDPQRGEILVDNHKLVDLQLEWLHKHMAVVAQDTQLFNMTIEENITYGFDDVPHEQVVAAATAANAHGFIESFPEGYNTMVGERGVRLSGGQRQRIAIARAIMRSPRILLLDEATSALDAESEAQVQQALDSLIQNVQQTCTVIIVAHRLSTVVNATNIIVLDEGRVIEQGTHSDLLALGGTYAQLVNRQLQVVSPTPQPATPIV